MNIGSPSVLWGVAGLLVATAGCTKAAPRRTEAHAERPAPERLSLEVRHSRGEREPAAGSWTRVFRLDGESLAYSSTAAGAWRAAHRDQHWTVPLTPEELDEVRAVLERNDLVTAPATEEYPSAAGPSWGEVAIHGTLGTRAVSVAVRGDGQGVREGAEPLFDRAVAVVLVLDRVMEAAEVRAAGTAFRVQVRLIHTTGEPGGTASVERTFTVEHQTATCEVVTTGPTHDAPVVEVTHGTLSTAALGELRTAALAAGLTTPTRQLYRATDGPTDILDAELVLDGATTSTHLAGPSATVASDPTFVRLAPLVTALAASCK